MREFTDDEIRDMARRKVDAAVLRDLLIAKGVISEAEFDRAREARLDEIVELYNERYSDPE